MRERSGDHCHMCSSQRPCSTQAAVWERMHSSSPPLLQTTVWSRDLDEERLISSSQDFLERANKTWHLNRSNMHERPLPGTRAIFPNDMSRIYLFQEMLCGSQSLEARRLQTTINYHKGELFRNNVRFFFHSLNICLKLPFSISLEYYISSVSCSGPLKYIV